MCQQEFALEARERESEREEEKERDSGRVKTVFSTAQLRSRDWTFRV